MGERPALPNRPFSTGDPLQDRHPILHHLERRHIHEIRGRSAVFGDQNGVFGFMQVGQYPRRLPLQRRDKFSSHEVIL
jgi:hypothetical protein